MTDTFGQQGPSTGANDYNLMSFVFQQLLQKMQTVTLVEVMAVTPGGTGAAGTVAVQPLVNQMTGNRTPVAHGTIYNIPYYRLQGGNVGAIIADPVVGEIGLCAFASRDISAVKSTRAAANPGSFRMGDYADGLYFGQFLALSPTQYLQFTPEGIVIVSPTKITLQAPTVAVEGDLTVSGTTVGTGEGTFNDIPVSTHTHGGVSSGGSNTAPPNP